MPDVKVCNRAGDTVTLRVYDDTEHIQKFWMHGRFYEAGMLEWTRRHYTSGTFIDAGACIGNHSIYYAKFCGADGVIAIEPNSPSYRHLNENVELNDLAGKILTLPVAISDTPGTCSMINACPKQHNNIGMHQVSEGDDVKVVTLDSIVESLELTNVTVVKIDVEHMEMEALRGAEKLLREQKPAVFIECPSKDKFKEVAEHLASLGYHSRSQHNATPTYEFIVPEEAVIKILMVSNYDFAGCGYFLSQAINQETSHLSRSIRYVQGGLGFPYDILAPNDRDLRRWWKWADVIHIHDQPGPLPKPLSDKPTVVTHHGTWYRQKPKHYESVAKANGWIATVATADLTRFGLPWLPDTRPDLSHLTERTDTFTVAHSPTGRKKKRTDVVVEACKRAGVPLDIIEATPWHETLLRRSRAHLVIEGLRNGYGCTAIESWSIGQPVIAGVDEIIKLRGLRAAIDGDLPLILSSPNADDLTEQIIHVRDDDEYREKLVATATDYVNRIHSYSSVAYKALDFYRQAMATHTSRRWRVQSKRVRHGSARMPPKGQRSKGAMTVLQFTGSSAPASWHGPATGIRYEFGKGRELGFVYDRDIPWFLAQKDKLNRSLFKLGA